jgi:aromatic ring-opening dioxygenase LigB subunit
VIGNAASGSVLFAALLPHAPILIPSVAGKRMERLQVTMGAVREASRRALATGADTIILISPHGPRQPDAFGIWSDERLLGTLEPFHAPDQGVSFRNDRVLVAQIARRANDRGVPLEAVTDLDLDHGTVVPLWFLTEAGWNRPVVALSLSLENNLNVVELGAVVAEAAADIGRRVAFIASGDMSHRLTAGPTSEARGSEFDDWLLGTLRRGAHHELLDFNPDVRKAAAEDALDSVLVGMGAIGFKAAGREVLSYEAPFGVGYGVAILYSSLGLEK